ncbi:hypothetical protein [Streptomyces alanosinicus]|nr:hypothetical protein [Streptomyces alanosinicus]
MDLRIFTEPQQGATYDTLLTVAKDAYIHSQENRRHVGHYEDVGLSGYDPNIYRPDFERMLEDARQ